MKTLTAFFKILANEATRKQTPDDIIEIDAYAAGEMEF